MSFRLKNLLPRWGGSNVSLYMGNLLGQWLNFQLFGITYLVGRIKFKLLFHCPLAKWGNATSLYIPPGKKIGGATPISFGLSWPSIQSLAPFWELLHLLSVWCNRNSEFGPLLVEGYALPRYMRLLAIVLMLFYITCIYGCFQK